LERRRIKQGVRGLVVATPQRGLTIEYMISEDYRTWEQWWTDPSVSGTWNGPTP